VVGGRVHRTGKRDRETQDRAYSYTAIGIVDWAGTYAWALLVV